MIPWFFRIFGVVCWIAAGGAAAADVDLTGMLWLVGAVVIVFAELASS